MSMLHIVILGLTFLTTEIYSTIIPQTVFDITSDALETNFQNPSTVLLPGNYIFNLIVRPETCSIRIGFETFPFNQPTKMVNTSAYTCDLSLNLLKLTTVELPTIELSNFCGELSGQHIYLLAKDYDEPILAYLLKKLILTVTIVPGMLEQAWNITLLQLPCCGAMEDATEKPKHSIAPVGCLQYHVEKEGVIESLNFFNGQGHYLSNLNYAICFKRYPNTCGIKFTGIDFKLATNGNSSYSTDRDCDTCERQKVSTYPPTIISTTPICNKDYIVIPDGSLMVETRVGVYASKYCGKSLGKLKVEVVTQGPLFLGVVTDGHSDPQHSEIGFKIKYKLLTNCKILY